MSPKTKTNDPVRSLRDATRGTTSDAQADAAAAKFLRRAERDGLLDIAYTEVDTPVGRLLLAATPRGLVRVTFPVESPETVLEQLASTVSPRILESPQRLDEVRRELDLYFDGKLTDFELPLDWQLTKGFYRKVLRATARIPYGKTRSYSQVAKRAGSPARGTSHRHRAGLESAPDRRALPPRPAQRWRPRRLRRRPRGQGDAARLRRGARAPTTSHNSCPG